MTPAPSKQKLWIAVLGALLPIALVAGIGLGGHPDLLPGFVRHALVGSDDGRTVNRALSIVRRDYYRKLAPGELVDRSIGGLVASLRDPFSRYLSKRDYRDFQRSERGGDRFSGVGMNVGVDPRGLRVSRVIAHSPAQRQGILAGDLVVAVDGRSIAGLASAKSTALVRGRPGTVVVLTIVRGGRRHVLRVKRARVEVPVVETATRRVQGVPVAVVGLHSFTQGVGVTVRRAVKAGLERGAKGIVLDLRDDGGGLLDEAVSVAGVFVPKGAVVTTAGRTRERHTYNARGGAIAARVPVVVLVNHSTASAAEIVAGALQDRQRARVVGTPTFGKGVFQEVEPLPNGGALDITVGEYFTPKGRNLGGGGVRQGAGIKPDITVAGRPNGKRDVQLDAALRALAPSLR